MHGNRRRRRIIGLALLAIVAGLLAAGCQEQPKSWTAPATAATPTSLQVRYSAGQTFLTWPEAGTGVRYNVYRSTAPITSANRAAATVLTGRWGPLPDDTSRNYLAGDNSPPNFIITDLGAPLSDDTGLFVRTVHPDDQGPAYYAVTAVRDGVEDPAIVSGFNATATPVLETLATTRPVEVSEVNDGLGRVYTQFMDYAVWNPTKQGYAYNYAVGLPRGYDRDQAYPIRVQLHAFGDRYHAIPETQYNWPAIQVLPDDPRVGLPDSKSDDPTWWFGFSAVNDYRDSAIPTSGTITNFTEVRVLKMVDEVAAMFRTDPSRTHVFGHSMGGSGSFSLGMRYGNVFSAIYASEPMTNYQDSPNFVDGMERLWGRRADNLPLLLGGPYAQPLRQFALGGAQPTGVWDWQNLQAQAVRLAPIGTAYIMVGSGKADRIVDWETQGRPLVAALTDAAVPFSALMLAGQSHAWMGFRGANPDMVSNGESDLGDFILMRGPVPALGNASGSGPLDPGDSGTQYYNTNISWATSTDARGGAPVDTADRFELTLWSRSGRQQTADVTPRRAALQVPAGSRWAWEARTAHGDRLIAGGTVVAVGAGTVTVPQFPILTGAGTRLVLTRAPGDDSTASADAPAEVNPAGGR